MNDPDENSSNSVFIWPGLVATPLGPNPPSKNPVNPVPNQKKRLTITLNAQQLQKCVPIGKPVVILPNTWTLPVPGTAEYLPVSEQQNVTALPSLSFSPPLKYQLMFTKQSTTACSGQSPAQCSTLSAPIYLHPSKALLQNDTLQPQTSFIQTSKPSSASSIPMVTGVNQIVNPPNILLTPKTDLATGKQDQLRFLSSSTTSNTINLLIQSTNDGSHILTSENTPMVSNDANKTGAPEKQKQGIQTIPSTFGTQVQRSFVVVTKDSETTMGSFSIKSSTAQPTSHGSETPKQRDTWHVPFVINTTPAPVQQKQIQLLNSQIQSTSDGSEIPKQGDIPHFPEVLNRTSAPVQQKQTKLLNSQILNQENIMSAPTKNPGKAGSKKEKHFIVTVPPTSGTQKRRRLVVITKELGKAKGTDSIKCSTPTSQIPKWARKIVKSGNIILTPIMGKPKGKQVKLRLSSSSIASKTSTSDIHSSTDGSQVQRRLLVVTKDVENAKKRLLVFTKDPEKAKGTESIKSSTTQLKGKILKQGNRQEVDRTLNPTQGRPIKQKQGNLSISSNKQTQRWDETLSSPTRNPHSGETTKENQQLKVILPHLSSPKSFDNEKLDMLERLSKLHSMVKDFSNEVNSLNKRFQSQFCARESEKQHLPTKKQKVAKDQVEATAIPTVYEDPPKDWSDEDPPMEDEIKWELHEQELETLLKGKLESSVNNTHQQEQDPLTVKTEPDNQQNASLQRDSLEVKTEQDNHQDIPLQQDPLPENTQTNIGSHQDEPLPQDPLLIKPEPFVDNFRSVSSQLDPLSIKTNTITEDGTFLLPCNVLPDSQLLSFGSLLDTPSEHDPLAIKEETNPLADAAQHLLEIKTEPDE